MTVYLMLFEARPRDLLAMVPLVVLTWVLAGAPATTLRSQRTTGNTRLL